MTKSKPPAQEPDRKPRLLILGHGRHGKDSVAELLNERYGFTFRSSSYFLAENVVRPGLARRGIEYPTLEACYEDRVNHRAAWREIIGEFNGPDPARLAKAILAVCDIYVGMRTDREYQASYDLFDAVGWVDAAGRGLPPEGRDSMDIDYDPKKMLMIDNNGTLEDLTKSVHGFVTQVMARGETLPLL